MSILETAIRRSIGLVVGDQRRRVISQNYNALRRILLPKREKEQHLLPNLIGKDGVAFEIGANYGQYLTDLAPLVGPKGHVHAFEPAEITFDCLQRICRIKRLTNVSLNHAALSNKVGTAVLHTPIKDSGTFGVAKASLSPGTDMEHSSETIHLDTLDRYVEERGLDRIDLIRCDVEGSEYNVLLGGRETFTRFRPLVLMEIHPGLLKRFDQDEMAILKYFQDLDYRAFELENGQLVETDKFVTENYFFFPEERVEAILQA